VCFFNILNKDKDMMPVDKFIEINGEEIYITDYREMEDDRESTIEEDRYEILKTWLSEAGKGSPID